LLAPPYSHPARLRVEDVLAMRTDARGVAYFVRTRWAGLEWHGDIVALLLAPPVPCDAGVF